MSSLLQGKTALVLGIANKWSIAYAIAEAFRREGATVILTYQGERLQRSLDDIGQALGAAKVFQCDVSKDEVSRTTVSAVSRVQTHKTLGMISEL